MGGIASKMGRLKGSDRKLTTTDRFISAFKLLQGKKRTRRAFVVCSIYIYGVGVRTPLEIKTRLKADVHECSLSVYNNKASRGFIETRLNLWLILAEVIH